MWLNEAIAALRAAMDDMGAFLTSTNPTGGPDAAGQNTLHVAELSAVPPGTSIVVGMGAAVEGHLVIATSAPAGPGTVTLATPLRQEVPAFTPIGLALGSDADYADAIVKAVHEYSRYRPLVKRYPDGGLALVPGQDTYPLPADFIDPDRDSFDQAVGLRSSLSSAGSLYALIYDQASRFTATGFGSSSNFGASAWYAYAPLNGDPADNPNGGMAPSQPLTYTFVRSAQPHLIVKPTPAAPRALDFFYKARHAVPTFATAAEPSALSVRLEDQHLIILYAKYLRCNALATGTAKITSHKAGSEEMSYAKTPQYYAEQAASALEFFRSTLDVPTGFAS